MAENNGALNAAKSSVQDVTFKKEEVYAPGGGFGWIVPPFDETTLLPPWGTPYRDYKLRLYARAMYNTLFMGAVNNLANEIASTPWQLYGKRNRDYYHKLLLNAEFGAGWRAFVKKIVTAYCVYDFGVPVEIIGRGDALRPVSGRVEGIATLDPLYCELTGNIQYPLIYRSERGGYHRMEATRVRRIVDSPQIDRVGYGRGLSSLSRYFGIMYAQILMGRYNVEKLSDLPPAGIVLLNNISGDFKDLVRQYEADRRSDGQNVWRNLMDIQSFDQDKASIDFVSFSQLPDNFDYDTRMRHDYNLVALSIGVDPQDVAPLSGGSLGSGQQSQVLDTKSKRKAPAIIMAELQTLVNMDVLPAYLEMEFTPDDEEGEKNEAETAQIWVNVAASAKLTDEEQRQLLANKVQAIRDVITDKDGNVSYIDTDVPEPVPDAISTPDAEEITAPAEDDATPGTDVQNTAPIDDEDAPDDAVEKAYSSTRDDFEQAMALTVDEAVTGNLTRVRAGIIVRRHLESYGRKAMIDGLSDGGVSVDTLEGDDLAAFNKWKVEQSAYVADLMDKIFKDGVQYTGTARGHAWANKSLNGIYQLGLLSADANGFYEWVLGATKEHCSTCAKNAGKIARLKWWHDNGCLPGQDCLECHGDNCLCKLKRRRKKAIYLPAVYRQAV
jgi:hypothetical protein